MQCTCLGFKPIVSLLVSDLAASEPASRWRDWESVCHTRRPMPVLLLMPCLVISSVLSASGHTHFKGPDSPQGLVPLGFCLWDLNTLQATTLGLNSSTCCPVTGPAASPLNGPWVPGSRYSSMAASSAEALSPGVWPCKALTSDVLASTFPFQVLLVLEHSFQKTSLCISHPCPQISNYCLINTYMHFGLAFLSRVSRPSPSKSTPSALHAQAPAR